MSAGLHTPDAGADSAPPLSRHRATVVLFGLAAGLVMIYGLLFMFSTRTVSVGAGEGGDVAHISRGGEAVDVTAHLVPGKYTVVDFYADWCIQCREITPYLAQLARSREDVAVRKINIVSWQTPVVAQYGLNYIPYLEFYAPDGALLAAGVEPVLAELRQRF